LKIIPDLHVISKSSFSCTFRMPTNVPVFSVTLMVLTPLPPRFVILYSSIWVRFPKPFSLTTKTVFFASPIPTHIMPITSSFLFYHQEQAAPCFVLLCPYLAFLLQEFHKPLASNTCPVV